MTDMTKDYLAAIEQHSRGFAQATRDDLDARVEHCPEWDVADLVWHLTEVHWFWATIAAERLDAPPDESRRPERPAREQLVNTFEAGAQRLVQVLGDADGDDHAWTWAPGQQNIAFITRHQVQEAAVHHWDAVHAAGGSLDIAAPVAVDAVEEFLTVSVSSDVDPAEPAKQALDATFALRADDADAAWTITDGRSPGTVRFERGAEVDVPAIGATASDLLLWLYQRVQLDASPVPEDVVARFRDLCYTD